MLAVIDYGAGNLRSVLHSLNYLHAQDVQVVHDADQLQTASKVILPGVGAFGAGMQQLHKQNLVEALRAVVQRGTPFLGICVGMQMLFDSSDEMGIHAGLGILAGSVTRFNLPSEVKVPHMGWNQLSPTQPHSRLLRQIPPQSYAYFVHSYYCAPTDPNHILLETEYGFPFASAVEHENIYGVQFHPEKSQQTGIQLLANFLEL